MKYRVHVIAVVVGIAVIALLVASPVGAQQKSFNTLLTPSLEMKYLLYLPQDYKANSGQAWPLLLFLHGGGESGSNIEMVKTHGPPMMINQGAEFPFMVLSPLNPHSKKFWNETALIQLLDTIQSTYAVDRRKIYIAGISRGGYGAWRMACQYPDRFAALIAICGETPDHYAGWLKDMPIWVFHGEDDRTISIKESDEMVAALKKNGNPVRYTRYPDMGHNVWSKAFSDPELFKWMLEQVKNGE